MVTRKAKLQYFSETCCGDDDNLTAGVIHVLYEGIDEHDVLKQGPY